MGACATGIAIPRLPGIALSSRGAARASSLVRGNHVESGSVGPPSSRGEQCGKRPEGPNLNSSNEEKGGAGGVSKGVSWSEVLNR